MSYQPVEKYKRSFSEHHVTIVARRCPQRETRGLQPDPGWPDEGMHSLGVDQTKGTRRPRRLGEVFTGEVCSALRKKQVRGRLVNEPVVLTIDAYSIELK